MPKSKFSKDIDEFLYLLFKHKVNYLITGGKAVIYYGYPRFTGDIDIFYSLEKENLERLFSALRDFWRGKPLGIKSLRDLSRKNQIIQYGVPPNRIDLMGNISGVNFKNAWRKKEEVETFLNGKKAKIYYISLEDLMKNKRTMKRFKDLEDLKYLKKARKLKSINRFKF